MQISDMMRQGNDQMPEKAEVSIEWRTIQNVLILIFILLLFKYLSGPVSYGSNVGSVGSSLNPMMSAYKSITSS